MVATIVASPIGVTFTAPWPIDTEIVSPGYHGCLRFASDQAVDATKLSRSPGRWMPVLPTIPSFSAYS